MACPTCKKPAEAAYKPFCSLRCKQVDLGRWFSGTYAVPTNEAPEDAAAANAAGESEE